VGRAWDVRSVRKVLEECRVGFGSGVDGPEDVMFPACLGPLAYLGETRLDYRF
jgi:hypothetical protein